MSSCGGARRFAIVGIFLMRLFFFSVVVIMGARGDTGGATGDGVLGIQSL